MKLRKSLVNRYSSKKGNGRREILGFGQPREKWSTKEGENVNPFVCKCGRSIYDHPCLTVGYHYTSLPYHGDLCPFLLIKE